MEMRMAGSPHSHRGGLCSLDHSGVLFHFVTTVSGREGIRRTFRYSLFLVASLSEGWRCEDASPCQVVLCLGEYHELREFCRHHVGEGDRDRIGF